jgi:uncharacterized membrane protein (UPF0136 family)
MRSRTFRLVPGISLSFPFHCRYAFLRQDMTANTLLWIYIVLLLVGGLIGFLKAKSKVSLIMSAAFAAALSWCVLGGYSNTYITDFLLAVLLAVFAMRLAKTKKFMPAGLMLILTIVILAWRRF